MRTWVSQRRCDPEVEWVLCRQTLHASNPLGSATVNLGAVAEAHTERVVVVVPCFNEATRLEGSGFAPLTRAAFRLLFVNDGSTDNTAEVLDALAATSHNTDIIHLTRNVGKAEAVRGRLLAGIESGASIVGFLDADLATPATEFVGLVECLISSTRCQVVLGSRIARLGSHIDRRMWRHYTGRVFATGASVVLNLPVYDTQCGAKVFRVTPALQDALRDPFSSRWAFDVELIGRLARGSNRSAGVPVDAFLEVPLKEWHDQPGGKLSIGASLKATLDLPKIAWKLRNR